MSISTYALWAFVRSLAQREDGADLGDELAPPTMALVDGIWRVTWADGTTTDYDDRDAAFAGIEASEWFAETTARKNIASWTALEPGRWVDAAAQEDLPSAIDGSQIRDGAIDEMAANLARERTPRPIDGGNISVSHESVPNDAALAAGRVFAGVRVTGSPDGQPHLWLFVRVSPPVDDAMDTQALAHGSVAFIADHTARYAPEGEEPEQIGAWLHSYALTNQPFCEGLEPHQPRATRTQPASGPRLAITRSRKIIMSARAKSATPPTVDQLIATAQQAGTRCSATLRMRGIGTKLTTAVAAERGEAADKLAAIAASLGLTEEQCCDHWKIHDVLCALDAAAKAEAAIEAGTPAAEPPAGGDRTDTTVRADGMEDMTPEQMTVWCNDAAMALAAVFGEGTHAELLDKLKASQELFAGAIANAASGDANAANAGPGDQAAEGERAAKAELVAVRTELGSMRTELGALRADKRRRDIRDEITQRFADAQLTVPTGEDLSELVALCEGCEGDSYRKLVERSVRAVNRPPQGIVTGSVPARAASGSGDAPTTQREALNLLREQVFAEQPDLRNTPDGKQRARNIAATRAAAAYPALFGKASAA